MQTQIFNISALAADRQYQIARALEKGAVAVFATDTVYGIGTGARCQESIDRIYALKKRPATQPLQLLVATFIQAQQIVNFSDGALRLAQHYWPGGLTLIVPPSRRGRPLLRASQALGLRIPAYLPLLRILALMNMPVASTSANLHGQPVLTREEDVIQTFNGQVDYILTDGTLSATASTVLDVTSAQPHVLRAGSIDVEEMLQLYHQEDEDTL